MESIILFLYFILQIAVTQIRNEVMDRRQWEILLLSDFCMKNKNKINAD